MDKKDYDKLIKNLLNEYKNNNFLDSSYIPTIDLYMDQVTTFMDEHLDLFKRNEEDKTLTKTMINNYSKSKLLPPTIKKKYSKDHILLLLLIYYLKPVLSITDIGTIISPLQELLLDHKKTHNLRNFYDILSKSQLDQFDDFAKQILETVERSKNLFSDESIDQNETLSIIGTIYMLSMQAALQRSLATSLIDLYLKPTEIIKPKDEPINKKNKSKK